jgi:hypothetical protein
MLVMVPRAMSYSEAQEYATWVLARALEICLSRGPSHGIG